MENPEQIEQEETLPSQPSSKRKYLLIGAIVTLAVLIVGAGILVLSLKNDVPSQTPEAKNPDVIKGEVLTDEVQAGKTADLLIDGNEEFVQLFILGDVGMDTLETQPTSYDIIIFDYSMQKFGKVASVNVPPKSIVLGYSSGKIIYSSFESIGDFGIEIRTLTMRDPKTEEDNTVITIPIKRKLGGFVVYNDVIFYAECDAGIKFVPGEQNDVCELKQTYFQGAKRGETTVLVKSEDMSKLGGGSPQRYVEKKDLIIFSNTTREKETNKKVNHFYGFSPSKALYSILTEEEFGTLASEASHCPSVSEGFEGVNIDSAMINNKSTLFLPCFPLSDFEDIANPDGWEYWDNENFEWVPQ